MNCRFAGADGVFPKKHDGHLQAGLSLMDKNS
jgi:hypothetical protein